MDTTHHLISSPTAQPTGLHAPAPVLESGRRKHAFANLPTPAGPTRGDRRGLKARPGGARPAAELAPDTRPTGTLAHVSSQQPFRYGPRANTGSAGRAGSGASMGARRQPQTKRAGRRWPHASTALFVGTGTGISRAFHEAQRLFFF